MRHEHPSYSRVALHLHRASIQSDLERPIYGARVAVAGFLDALVRHGEPGHYAFYYTADPFGGPEPAREFLDALITMPSRGTFEVRAISELKHDFQHWPCRAWHDADADFESAARMRASYAHRLYPITAMTHVYSYQELLHDWILKLLLADSYPCDRLICPGQAARQALVNILDEVAERLERDLAVRLSFKGEVIHIPYGINTEQFRPHDKIGLRRELALPEHALLILWVGRISPVDKADLLPLLHVHRRLVLANPSAPPVLVIAGSGPDAHVKLLKAQIDDLGLHEAVHLIDPMPPSRRHLVHAAADIFVSLADNIQEACGITPLEALASGVPQVVSDWDGYGETVVQGVTGFVVPTFWVKEDGDICLGAGLYDDYDHVDHFQLAQAVAVDLDALQSALQTLIDREDLRAQMASASRARAVARHSAKRIVVMHEDLWRDLARSAADLTLRTGGDRRYDTPAFVDMFGHYGTQVVDDRALVAITDAGRRVAVGQERLPVSASQGFLSAPLLEDLLGRLAACDEPMTLGQLVEHVGQSRRPLPSAARRHVLWLFKYGLVYFPRPL